MKTIYKYPLTTTDIQAVSLPLEARILTVQTQGGVPCMWAEVDAAEVAREGRIIRIFGTGHPLTVPDDRYELIYIGTYQLQGGALIFHVYEEVRKERES